MAAVDRPGHGDRPDERGEQPDRSQPLDVAAVERSLRGDTAREIWTTTAERFQDRADKPVERPGTDTTSETVDATDQPSQKPDPSAGAERVRPDQPGDQLRDRPETRDWRSAIEATTPEIAKGMLANRTYVARVDIAVEDAKGIPADHSAVDRSLADRWDRFGDSRDHGVSDEDIATAYERQVKRDGPPEAEAAYRVGREWVVETDGPAGLRTPGRLDKAIGEAAESILTARGFRASADQPEPGRHESEADETPKVDERFRPSERQIEDAREWLRENYTSPLEEPKQGHKTWGVWWDDTGGSGADCSGRNELAKQAETYLAECGYPTSDQRKYHLEVQLATRMRQAEIQEMTVAINNVMCTTPWGGCDRLVRQILPEGSTMRVLQHDGTEATCRGEASW